MNSNQLIVFLKKYKGSGLSISQLSTIYHKEKQFGGRFMCCSTLKEEELVKDYIRIHQDELVHNLSHLNIIKVLVKASRKNTGSLGRFIIGFHNAQREELYHFTIVCENPHWDEMIELREPHLTANKENYYYTFNKDRNTLTFRDVHRKISPIPQEIVDAMRKC